MTPQVSEIIKEIINQIDGAVELHNLYKVEDEMPEFADGYYRGKISGLLNILWHISYENFTPCSESCPFRYFWKQYATVSGLSEELEIFEIFKKKLG